MEKAAQNIDEEADYVAQETPDKLDQLIETEAIAAQVLNDLKETIIDSDYTSEQEDHTSMNIVRREEITRIDIEAPRSFNEWLTAGSTNDQIDEKKEFLTFEKPKVPFFSPVKKAK